MSDFNGFSATGYQQMYQPNMYYQPQVNTAGYPVTRFPQQYQNTVPTTYQQQLQQPNGLSGSMNWVQGEAGAKAFTNLQPGVPVALWDSEEPVIYIKTVDNTGKPSMTILDYTERKSAEAQKEEVKLPEYVTKEEMISLESQYSSFSEKLDKLNNHVEEIENRITSFGKPQSNQNRRSNK